VSRFVFVVPPWTGHVNPTVSVAQHLRAAGHTVEWIGYRQQVGHLLPEGAVLHALGDEQAEAWMSQVREGSQHMRTLESLKFLWESLIVPLARAMRQSIEEIIAKAPPDLLIVDHQAVGGALAARRTGVPWASFCTTSASIMDTLSALPKVKAWVDEQRHGLEREVGLPEWAAPDLSPERVIVFSTEALVGDLGKFPAHFRFVGPAIGNRPDASGFPWEQLASDRPIVFVSLGTINADRGPTFYQLVAEALGDAPLQVVLVAPDGFLPAPPANFIVRPRVPQLALLPRVNAVVSHAGHNTVCESLANGLPLLVTPIRDDQPVVAEQVVQAGAGLRLPFGRLTAKNIRAAVDRLLAEPSFRDNAARVRESFAQAGGAASAARLLVEQVGAKV
jgi:MGT family glycosyltransferase